MSSRRSGFTLIELLVVTPRQARGKSPRGFTLIELLIVIAIIAILSVVVVLTLSPAELLRQARDQNRLSDMDTLTHALSLYTDDSAITSIISLGTSSIVYVSLPDSSSTCGSWNLPILPTGYAYHCAPQTTYRKPDSTGWIPVNFSGMTTGSPLGQLPVDPVNASSSRLYDTYTTDGTKFELTTALESQKYKLGGSNDVVGTDGGTLATVYERGSKLGLEPLDYGDSSLVGLWTFDEGTSSVAYDYSGNNAAGSWQGTLGSQWAAGRVGPYAGSFNGTDNYVDAGNPLNLNITSNITMTAWVNEVDCSHHEIANKWGSGGYVFNMYSGCTPSFYATGGTFSKSNTWIVGGTSIPTGAWYHVAVTYDGNNVIFYVNGVSAGSTAATGAWNTSAGISFSIARDRAANWFKGSIDDVRVYNRALSAAEIQAMYNGGK